MKKLLSKLMNIFAKQEGPVQPVKKELTEEEKERIRDIFQYADESEMWG